jgi:hypothetical protein
MKAPPLSRNFHTAASGAGIERVFEQFLDHGRGTVHHLAGGDLVGDLVGEYVDAAHGLRVRQTRSTSRFIGVYATHSDRRCPGAPIWPIWIAMIGDHQFGIAEPSDIFRLDTAPSHIKNIVFSKTMKRP